MSPDQVGRHFKPRREPEFVGLAERRDFATDAEYRKYLRRLADNGARPPQRLLALFNEYCASRGR